MLHLAIEDGTEVEHADCIIEQVLRVEGLETLADDRSGHTLGFGDGVDVLDLDEGFHLFLQHAGEETLQLTATEIPEDGLPVWWVLEVTQVWAHVSTEHSEGGRLANTVLTDETQDLAGAGRGQSVELEGVGTVSVGGLTGKTLGQVDNANSVEGAALDTLTAPNAECFRDEANR